MRSVDGARSRGGNQNHDLGNGNSTAASLTAGDNDRVPAPHLEPQTLWGTLSGVVTDRWGNAVSHGVLKVALSAQPTGPGAWAASTAVGTHGRFETRVPLDKRTRAQLSFCCPGLLYARPMGVAVSPGEEVESIRLVAMRVIERRVRITDWEGQPVQAAEVRVTPSPTVDASSRPRITDARGEVTLPCTEGSGLITARGPDGARGARTVHVEKTQEESPVVELRLRGPMRLTHVRCVSSDPLDDLLGHECTVRVRLASGAREIDLRVGGPGAEVPLSLDDKGRVTAEVLVEGGARFDFGWPSLDAAVRDDRLSVDIGQRGVVTLRLEGPRGEPLPRLGVYVGRDSRDDRAVAGLRHLTPARTDDQGDLVVCGLPYGRYSVFPMPVIWKQPGGRGSSGSRQALSAGEFTVDSRHTERTLSLRRSSVVRVDCDALPSERRREYTLRVEFRRDQAEGPQTCSVRCRVCTPGPWHIAIPEPPGTDILARLCDPVGDSLAVGRGRSGVGNLTLETDPDRLIERVLRVRYGSDLRPGGWVQFRPLGALTKPVFAHQIRPSDGTIRKANMPSGAYGVFYCSAGPTGSYERAACELLVQPELVDYDVDVSR